MEETLFRDAGGFLRKASTMMLPQEISISICEAFFKEARIQLSIEEDLSIEEIEGFLQRAEKLLGKESLGSQEIDTFLTFAREHVMNEAERMLSEMEIKVSSSEYISAVNFLEVFGISLRESPHSRLIAWLLDDNKPHGLGSSFLVSFLEEVKRIHGFNDDLDLAEINIVQEKPGESGYPDIVIEGSGFICVIENKIGSAEGLDQTRRYADDCNKEAKRIGINNQFLVFLTPQGREPKDNRFKPFSYSTLISLLEECPGDASIEARFIIDQLIMNLRKNVLKEFSREEKTQGLIDRCESGGEEYILHHFGEVMDIYKEVCNG